MATKKTATPETFAFAAAFDPSKMGETYREFAEKGMAQSKEAYDKMKASAEDATKTVEQTLETAQAGSVEFGLKAIDAMRANTEKSLSHLEAMLGVKTVSELVELQTAFVRSQAETAVEQAREMQDAMRKLTEDVTQHGKAAYEKAAKSIQTA